MRKKKNEGPPKYPALAKFMAQAWDEWSGMQTGTVFKKDFGKACGNISGTMMGRYIDGEEMPKPENLAKLAAVVGVGIYDALGLQRVMPDDPDIQKMAALMPKLRPGQRKEFLEKMEKMAEANLAQRLRPNPIQQPQLEEN